MIRETNWAGNHTYRATTMHRPESIEQLREIVSRAPRIHGLGSRHCFNDIADSAELVSIDAIEPPVEIDREAMTVAATAGHALATVLAEQLAATGVPFRDAHWRVGDLVAQAEARGCDLAELPAGHLRELLPELAHTAPLIPTLSQALEAADLPGGTAPRRVREALHTATERL